MQTQPLEFIFWVLVVVSGIFLYLLPAIVAIRTKHTTTRSDHPPYRIARMDDDWLVRTTTLVTKL
jgi:hypothetical protein